MLREELGTLSYFTKNELNMALSRVLNKLGQKFRAAKLKLGKLVTVHGHARQVEVRASVTKHAEGERDTRAPK